MKKLFSLLLTLIILLFSVMPVYADTTVNDNDKQALLRESCFQFENDTFNLNFLPSADYLTFINKEYINGADNYNVVCKFIPHTNKKIVNLGLIDYEPTENSDFDTIYLYAIKGENGDLYLKFSVCFTYYYLVRNHDNSVSYGEVKSAELPTHFANEFITVYDSYDRKNPYNDILFVNNENIYNTFIEYEHFAPFKTASLDGSDTYLIYDYSLFYNLTQIVPGYTGTIFDSSLEFIINSNATDCDSNIIDKYEYKIYYARNNVNEYVFLNNTYEPKVEKSQYTGNNTELAYKYKFTYQNTSTAIVYFPRLNKYLSYDDWYELQPKDNNFKWFWDTSDDNKSFNLYSDWTYNNGDYTGTRVAYSWDSTNGMGQNLDYHSFASVIEDKEYFLNNGWKSGRPKDVNYPYCIEIDYDGKPTLFLYSNSKFNRISSTYYSETCREFEVNILTSYGYIYNAVTDTYINYDMTVDIGKSQYQKNTFKIFSFLFGLDNDFTMHLWDNYKGTPDNYIGTRVFFNFKLSDFGFREEMNIYTKPDIGKFVDDNGNSHGGNLKDYTDADLNKFNTAGSNSTNNSYNDFEFSYDNVYDYVDDYFYFIERVFSIFPPFIWVILSLSLTLLIVLRVLGR